MCIVDPKTGKPYTFDHVIPTVEVPTRSSQMIVDLEYKPLVPTCDIVDAETRARLAQCEKLGRLFAYKVCRKTMTKNTQSYMEIL